jgi:ribosomal-protein-alanine N-acetyltransferase
MGILIGNKEYRGKGVTPEVLNATANWLKQHKHIRQIVLGVAANNHAAIRAYEKVGFIISKTPFVSQPLNDCITMQWVL